MFNTFVILDFQPFCSISCRKWNMLYRIHYCNWLLDHWTNELLLWSQISVRFALSLTVTEIAFLVKSAIFKFFITFWIFGSFGYLTLLILVIPLFHPLRSISHHFRDRIFVKITTSDKIFDKSFSFYDRLSHMENHFMTSG